MYRWPRPTPDLLLGFLGQSLLTAVSATQYSHSPWASADRDGPPPLSPNLLHRDPQSTAAKALMESIAITMDPLIREAGQLLPTALSPSEHSEAPPWLRGRLKRSLSRHWDQHEGMFHNWNLRVLLLPINKARKIYTARSAHSVLNLQNSSTTVCRLFFFAFKKKNYLTFYWGIIALQTFAVFCQASTWISHRYTYTPSLLKLPPVSLSIPPF